MPSPEDKNRQKNSEEQNDKSFAGNEEKQIGADNASETSTENTKTDRDAYRTRNLEIEKERD